MRKFDKCCECEEKAEFARVTQFAGIHPYCAYHAKQEEDFGLENSGGFYWVGLEDDEKNT